MERGEKSTGPSPKDLNNSPKKVQTPPSPNETDKSSSCTPLTHEPKRPGETTESATANPPLSMASTSHCALASEEICPSDSRSNTHSLALSEDNSKDQAASQHQLQGWVYETRNSMVDMPERLVKLDWENQDGSLDQYGCGQTASKK